MKSAAGQFQQKFRLPVATTTKSEYQRPKLPFVFVYNVTSTANDNRLLATSNHQRAATTHRPQQYWVHPDCQKHVTRPGRGGPNVHLACRQRRVWSGIVNIRKTAVSHTALAQRVGLRGGGGDEHAESEYA